MTHPSYILLYVNSPQASGRFYQALLASEPVESTETFVLFALETGLKLGLWSRHTVDPAPSATGGGGEIGFKLDSDAEVDATHAHWQARGIQILQAPTVLDFGRTFVGLDPDGHRLRVYALAQQ
ncbi:MAG: VOC family protein [Phreatobacter sp.]